MYDKQITIVGTNLGYQYFIDYSHPLATGNSGRVLLHRHNASIKLGRWLSSDEHVHHIDENKLNNSLDNLLVMSIKEHNNIHNPKTILVCKNCGCRYTSANNDTDYCSTKCYGNSKVRDKTITKELLDSLIPNNTWKSLGKLFGYSDVGIRKRALALGCNVPVRNNRST